ncbi:MAG: aminotransferase class III-fold pyridoxal phosphate-dependent enzyme, partial [Candidatus Latescibacteria bacterium]|nr:aminotransferase class III-fold pyridoxal phosphate-dependent enzyme [Candidatus Latescibacterota bacterium]
MGDGDVSGAIWAARPEGPFDLLMGIGAAPEGVISATAIRGLGGVFEGKLVFRSPEEESRAEKMVDDDLTGNAARLESVLVKGIEAIQAKHPDVVGHVTCKGLVAGVQMVKAGEKVPDPDLAHEVILRCFHRGLLFFAPVGAWGQTVKISPPLTITQEALEDGLQVLQEVVDEVCR